MKGRVRIWIARILAVLALALAVAGFSSRDLRYAVSAAVEHLRLMAARRPIEDVIDLPDTPADVRAKLRLLSAARRLASDDLALPNNGSYTTYVDVGRPELAWNVFATRELSIQPLEWCFPVVGCVVYRGYSYEQEAREFAATLNEQGHDTYVSGVTAYSTLGWFEDSVLSTFIGRSSEDLAAIVFHELAHAQLYVQGDSAFNESFATTVEREGMRRWLRSQGQHESLDRVVATWRRREARVRLMLATREDLDRLFSSETSVEEKRQRKSEILDELRQALCVMAGDCKDGQPRRSASRDTEPLNNAYLVAVGTYHTYVPGFEALLDEADGNLPRFYKLAKELGELTLEERKHYLLGEAGHL
ncbi:MAG: aminopeptidase [Acidobacteria bacterium]|nr:aminopeptidase [Acidobacteriota bacterium]